MALRAVPDHPKFARLKSFLKLNKACTLGYLEAVWHFCGKFTPHGNIGKYSAAEIEEWVEWDGEEGALIAAMVKAKWIDDDPDHGLIVHDWHKHADDAAKLAVKRSGVGFIVPTVSQHVGTSRDMSGLPGSGSGSGAEPVSGSGAEPGAVPPEATPQDEPPVVLEQPQEPEPEPEPEKPELKLVETPWYDLNLNPILRRIVPGLLACRSGGKQVFEPESFSEQPMLKVCDRILKIAPDPDAIDGLIENLQDYCASKKNPPYSSPSRVLNDWLDKREPDWLRLRRERERSRGRETMQEQKDRLMRELAEAGFRG